MKQAARVAPATCPSKMRCQIGGFPTPAAKSVVTERQSAPGHFTSMLCAAGVREPRKRHRIMLRYARGSIRAIYFMRNMQTELPPTRWHHRGEPGNSPHFGRPEARAPVNTDPQELRGVSRHSTRLDQHKKQWGQWCTLGSRTRRPRREQ